ncbi:hypothetical protein ACMT1E_04445 [Sphingomonas flavalba]|uniref:hypothetical protein n=1 Tax=Sphingomonas flavalba TaxID=2559804 RepID=UPI0039E0ED1D
MAAPARAMDAEPHLLLPQPLDPHFAEFSDGCTHPRDVPFHDRRAEIIRELDLRRRTYGTLVERGRIPQAAAERETALMAAIADDMEAEQRFQETGIWAQPVNFDWVDKTACLRREICIRRAWYARRIADGKLRPDDARRQQERIEAVHWMYWRAAFCWTLRADEAPPDWANPRPAPASERARNRLRAHFAQFEGEA